MKVRNTYQFKGIMQIVFAVLILVFNGCVEPYEGSFSNFEDTLVVNATLTNAFKRHEIQLARSYQFEDDGPIAEENAQITIVDSNGTVYEFEESKPGTYLSIAAFSAGVDNSYYMTITTESGRSYQSSTMQLPKQSTQLDQLYAERTVDDNGIEGIGIFIDTYDPTNSSNYYRFEYEETYKVIAPFWSPLDIVLIVETARGPEFNVILREQEERVCYGFDTSDNINIIKTTNLSEDRLTKHQVRFINRNRYILQHRYSILLRQYVQSPEAYQYYEVLNGLSQSSTDLFSEDQPGFVAGNIFSLDDSEENVAGFFEVSAVDEKRIFVNFEDYFPGEDPPSYIITCEPILPDTETLISGTKTGTSVYYDNLSGVRTVPRVCGDCTALGSNKKPDFWIE